MFRLWSLWLGIAIWSTLSQGENNVGCLFSKTVCDAQTEWCFDDYAFGRCLPTYGDVPNEAMYRYDLERSSLHALEREMQRLFALGYRWSHSYTQCVVQAILYATQLKLDYDLSICDSQVDQDLDGALKAIEGDDEITPWNMAFVRFTPSANNPHPEFADEVYYPSADTPPKDRSADGNHPVIIGDYAQPTVDADYSKESNDLSNLFSSPFGENNVVKKTPTKKTEDTQQEGQEELLPATFLSPSHFSTDYNTPDRFRQGINVQWRKRSFDRKSNSESDADTISMQDLQQLAGLLYDLEEAKERQLEEELLLSDDSPEDPGTFLEKPVQPVYTEGGMLFVPGQNSEQRSFIPEERQSFFQPISKNKDSNDMSIGLQNRYVLAGNDIPPLRLQPDDDFDTDSITGYLDSDNLLDYDNLLSRLAEPDWGGFKRRERLDVKKPGPRFTVNNYAFDNNEDENYFPVRKVDLLGDPLRVAGDGIPQFRIPRPAGISNENEDYPVADLMNNEETVDNEETEENRTEDEILRSLPVKSVVTREEVPTKKESSSKEENTKAETTDPKTAAYSDAANSLQFDVVDTSYTYVGVKNTFTSYKEGSDLVKLIAELLNLPRNVFSNLGVERNQVTFKVEPNSRGMNASTVAKEIDSLRSAVKNQMGIEIIATGIGDRTKIPSVVGLYSDPNRLLYILTFVLCGVVAAILVAAAALYVIRRHARTREKLQSLTHPDTEASKDYQELCRARMASKNQEKPEPIHVAQRIASLSRESEGSNNSPSSRSSTSSWSEEPVLTNMDISTGHMVLSYMEDHLKNKDRLEQEWIALCAYEAEPCATTIAVKSENLKKNRFQDTLPYDHSRVVLNDLSNIYGSDYINASTITDHDPRNPAYIATQGPLPHTAADFWQMIWEQGSVVLVMLTRLTENGTAMSHRYWPEEGSELYHIYEVHLVSEHIWCDDYLVRSFYLKNLKTGETRTVTQFHFLSWPDKAVPLSTKALLEFRRKVNKSYRGRSCPIVVHCSDGVGRTGTYCLIDMVLNRMAKGAKEIDIAATLEHIRDQRPRMVKTKQQFEFVLMAVAEEVHAILKALPQ